MGNISKTSPTVTHQMKASISSNKVDLFPDENYWQLPDVLTSYRSDQKHSAHVFLKNGVREGLVLFIKPSSLFLTRYI